MKNFGQTLIQDLRYGVRMLWKHKGFTAVALLSLALGIGANTALFSVVDAVLLRMLPVKSPDQLVLFEWRSGERYRNGGMRGVFVPSEPGTRGASMFRADMFDKLRAEQQRTPDSPLAELFAHAPLYGTTAVFNQQAESVETQCVSGNYYTGLGVPVIAGRTISESDDKASAPPVAVLSHHYWQKSFGANPAFIGQQMTINQKPFTIIGITPPGFVGALQIGTRIDVTVPMAFEPILEGEDSAQANATRPPYWWVHLMGRLKPGAAPAQAQASFSSLFQTLALDAMPAPRNDKQVSKDKLAANEYPRLVARSGSQGGMEIRSMQLPTIYGLFGVVAAVLLIACANVANLLLARAALRGSEISLRLAVGASRWRLIRQLLTESVLLSLLGGAFGVIVAFWGKAALGVLTGLLPTDLELEINGKVLLFTFAVSVLTGVLFGLVPAIRATKLDLNSALKQSKRTATTVSRLSKGLIVVQVALSLLLLLGAGLFIRTLRNLQQVNVGFNQDNLLLFELSPERDGYKEERLVQFYEQFMARLDALPGVRAATFGTITMIGQNMWNTTVLLPGEKEGSSDEHTTNRQMARENYFATLEIPLLRGRGFTPSDDMRSPLVGIVNQEFARKFFPNGDALGQRVTDTDNKHPLEIIGIVADTKYDSQRSEIEPLMVTPWRQELKNVGGVHFAIRTTGEPTALSGSVRQAVRELDSNLPIKEFKTQLGQASDVLSQERLYARLLSFFGVLALLLAAIGLSGVLGYAVTQRTNEIGIRMALGAQAGDVLRMVIGQGMKLVMAGIVFGAAGGYALKRVLASQVSDQRSVFNQLSEMLYGVKATDPWMFALVAGLLLLTALLACWIPARRAARVDPLVALRHE